MPIVLQVRLTALLLRLAVCAVLLPGLVADCGICPLARRTREQRRRKQDNRRAMRRSIPEIMDVLPRKPVMLQSMVRLAFQVFGKR